MMHALLIMLGLGISFTMPGIGWTGAFLIGIASGLAGQIKQAIWPAAKPTFVDPVNRPRPINARHQVIGALVVAAIGVLPIVVAYVGPLPALSPWPLYGFYLGGMAEGTAAGLLLTSRKAREAHNRWIASMSPQSLGVEQ